MAQTIYRGTIYETTDQSGLKRDVSEILELLDPFETPMLNMVGRDSLHSPCEQVKHEWMQDRLIPRTGTLSAAHTAGSNILKLASGQGKYIVVDDLILSGNIVFKVTAGPPDSDTMAVDVIRGTDATIANASAWYKLSSAVPEGSSAKEDTRKTSPEFMYNYTQIMRDQITVTGTMEVIKRYGYVSERAYLEEKAIRAQALDFEYTTIYGVRSYEAGPPRKSTMGGLFEFVFLQGLEASPAWSQVYNANSGDFTETMFNNVLQTMWELGAHPDFVMLNGTNKRRVSAWGKPFIRTERSENMVGATIGQYESDFGIVEFILNRNLRASDIIIGTRGQIGIGPLNGRQMSSRKLPSMVDGSQYEILGEYTMEVHKPSVDFGWIYNTSTVY